MPRAMLLLALFVLVACGRGEAPGVKPAEPSKPSAEARPPAPTLPGDAAGVVQLLKERGLPIGETLVYTAENDPNKLLGRPNQYTGKAAWLDTRLPRENKEQLSSSDGGTVETFANATDLEARRKYVEAVTSAASPFVEYAFTEGTVLVRISKRLTPDQAAQYEALLKNPAAAITPIPSVAQQAAPTSAPAPPAAKPAEKPVAATSTQRVRVAGAGADGVNMRTEPSTTAARVKLLRDGAQLEIVGEDRQADGRTWRNVKDGADGATGWIAAEFVADAAPSAPAPAQEKPVAPAAPAAAPKPAAPAKPAGGSIVCKDGSTWSSATRQGACSGRGGIAPGY